MSNLSNMQLRKMITGLKARVERDQAAGERVWRGAAARRRREKLAAYMTEMERRGAAGADPDAREIQTDRRVGR